MAKTLDEDVLRISMQTYAQAQGIAVQAGVPIIAWGDPGIGKTATNRMVCRQLNYMERTVIASLHAPEDFLGMPFTQNGRLSYIPPDFAMDIYEQQQADLAAVAKGGKAMYDGYVIFLDEASTAPPSVQAAMLRMVHEGIVGRLKLENVTFIAAANPANIAAGGWELAAPLANRFCHLNVRLDVPYLVHGMTHGFDDTDIPRLPKGWKESYLQKETDIVGGYLFANQAMALQMPDDASAAGYAWASPRSWYDLGAMLLAACQAVGASKELYNLLIGGCVGTHTANQFLTWREKLDLPNPEDLISGKVALAWQSSRLDRMYVILQNLVSAMRGGIETHKQDENVARWKKVWSIFRYCNNQGGKEQVAAAAQDLSKIGRAQEPRFPLPIDDIVDLVPLLREAGLLYA